MQLEFTRKSISDEGAALKETLRDLQTAAAKSLQSCPIPCDPIDGSHQAPPSLGFSRQEHWSGLPLPSPMQESEKWKWSRSAVSDSSRPHGLQPTRPFRPWDFPGKSTGVGCHCLLQRSTKGLPQLFGLVLVNTFVWGNYSTLKEKKAPERSEARDRPQASSPKKNGKLPNLQVIR